MESETNKFEISNNGTVFDSATGLMWMIACVGQGWSNNLPQGIPPGFTWSEATDKYGRARYISGNWDKKDWDGDESKSRIAYYKQYPLNKQSYENYRFGQKKYEFAGFNDWRMPTIEEFWTLSEKKPRTTDIITDSGENWTANPSTKLLHILSMINMGGPTSWMFSLYDNNGYCDWLQNISRPIRLVRQGNIFQTLF